MSEELKTCPLCHGKVEMEQTSKKGYTIKCKNCLIELNSKCHHYSIDWLKNTMIERWNTRPEPRCDMCKTDCEYCLTYLNTDSNKDATEFYCADFEERE